MLGFCQHYLHRLRATVLDAITKTLLRNPEEAQRNVFGEFRGETALMKMNSGFANLRKG
jgi:hypothetical protein